MKKISSAVCCFAMMNGGLAPAFAAMSPLHLQGAVGVPAVGPLGASLVVPVLGPALPYFSMPATLTPTILPVAAAMPQGPSGEQPAEHKPDEALSAAQDLSSHLTPSAGEAAGTEKAQEVSKEFFDQGAGAPGEPPAEPPTASNGEPLNHLYPKVVFIQDVFNGPAPDEIAGYVNALIDRRVHVVFMTWRPQKGPGSADEVLLSRVKQSVKNPLVVVSFNGGKISLHGRAANPKPLIENMGQFSPENVAKIKTIADKLAVKAGGAATVLAFPTEKEAFSLTLTIPGPSRAKTRGMLNTQLKNAGLPYRAEAHEDDANALIIHSMPLRFSLKRVYDALEEQFPGENLSAQPEKYLAITDSRKSPRFSTAFPKLAEVQVASDGGGVGSILGAVLGERNRLPAQRIRLGKLAYYLAYWEPRHKREFTNTLSSGSGGNMISRSPEDQTLKGFVTLVVTRTLTKTLEYVHEGQHQFANKSSAVEARIEEYFNKPLENGVFVTKKIAAALAAAPFGVKQAWLRRAKLYAAEFYDRNLRDFQIAAVNIMRNQLGLSSDINSLVTLYFKSSATGKIYTVDTRLKRVMRTETSQGLTLTAYDYRPFAVNERLEKFYAKMYAMAMLRAHARRGQDNRWHEGRVGPNAAVVTRLDSQFDRTHEVGYVGHDASEFDFDENDMIEGPIVHEITALIERMEADAEFQIFWEEHEKEATKEDLKKKTSSEQGGKKSNKKKRRGGKK